MKPLVVYFSYSGITRRLAEDIALIIDGDLRELKPEKPHFGKIRNYGGSNE